MRILFLEGHEGTFYLFHKELAEELIKRGHEVCVSAPSGDFTADIKKIGCKCIDAPLNRRSVNPVSDFKLFIYYIKLIKKFKPNIVLTYTIKPGVYGGMACQVMRAPYISDITGLGTAIENKGPLRIIALTLYKLGLNGAECVFFENAQNQKLFIAKKIVKNKYKTRLTNGAGVNLTKNNLEEYPPDFKNFKNIKNFKNLKNKNIKNIKFLFVGRIMKNKGVDELLDAFKNINFNNFNFNLELDIIGGCEENEYIKKLNEAHEFNKNIIYHGVQQNVHEFYKNSHCVILPSYHEGMANVLQEAAATGRPVIASKIPGCMETFDENISGIGCDAKSASSLENAIKKFLDLSWQERRDMGLNGRKKMEREFDRSIVVKAYIDEINKIIKY